LGAVKAYVYGDFREPGASNPSAGDVSKPVYVREEFFIASLVGCAFGGNSFTSCFRMKRVRGKGRKTILISRLFRIRPMLVLRCVKSFTEWANQIGVKHEGDRRIGTAKKMILVSDRF